MITAKSRTLMILLIAFMALGCNTETSIGSTPTRSVQGTTRTPLPSPPTGTAVKPNNPIENHCLESAAIEDLLPKMDGVLLLRKNNTHNGPTLLNMSSLSEKEILISQGSFAHDFVVSPNRQLVAMAISNQLPPSETTKLLIVDAQGTVHKEWAWNPEWGRLASWLDDRHIIIARQADLQLSIPNPDSVIAVDVDTGAEHEIVSAYPDHNKVSYVNWNLINYVYSQDITRVLYPTSKVESDYVNYVALRDLTTNKNLAELPVELSETSLPEWSPTDHEVVIAGLVRSANSESRPGHRQELFTIDKSGKISQITHFADYYSENIRINQYSFSPDGHNIAFWIQIGETQDPQLAVLNLESDKVADYCISGLRYKNVSRPLWSPSGKFLEVEYNKSDEDTPQVLVIDISDETVTSILDDADAVSWLEVVQ